MSVPFPEPVSLDDVDLTGPGGLTARWLDYLRATAVAKVAGLPVEQRDRSVLPSGWTPLGLLWHLAHMEHRWFAWGFEGRARRDPWGDHGPVLAGDDEPPAGWRLPDGHGLAEVAAVLEESAQLTRAVLAAHPPTARAAVGGRFATVQEAPRLGAICLHVVQEYARHLGHLDVVVELTAGATGE